MRDPIFDDIPWDIITDDAGRVIGTVYVLLPDPPPRRRQKERRGRIMTQITGRTKTMNDVNDRFEQLEEALRRPLTKFERSKLEQLERPALRNSGVVYDLLGDMLTAIERIQSQLADVTFRVFVAHDYLQVGQAAAALDELRKAMDRVQE